MPNLLQRTHGDEPPQPSGYCGPLSEWPMELRDEFLNKYFPFIRNVAKKRGFSPSDSDDLAQKLGCRVIQIGATYVRKDDSAQRLWSWVFGVFWNVIREHCREVRKQPHQPELIEAVLNARSPDPFITVCNRDLADMINKRSLKEALAGRLSDHNWELGYFAIINDELEIAEIAREFNVLPQQVSQAKKKVKDRLRAYITRKTR